MCRTVYCPEEVIVVSKGKEDIGKLVELANDGKFDPSVIPEIDSLQDRVTKEVTERTAADKQLQENIDSEAVERKATDKDLQDKIAAEVATRTNGDTQLQANLEAEINTRVGTDQNLQDQVTVEIAARISAVETESNTRSIADQELQKQINELNIIGNVQYFARQTAPTGWLKADGSAVSRIDYANLFDAVGTMFGAGDGSTTFNLPDLRGEFLRGFDDGRGVDTGRIIGSSQTEMLKSHTHNFQRTAWFWSEVKGGGNYLTPKQSSGIVDTDDFLTSPSTTATGGTETRPRNIALLACIKY